MKSNSKRERSLISIASGRPVLFFLASAVFLSIMVLPLLSLAVASLPEMARLEASDAVTIDGTRSLFKGYMSLGLLPEAASLLERRVRLGVFPTEAAAPLFDEVVNAHGHFDEPERLVAVCETAIRSGIRTPLILYLYGTGLRGIRGRLGDASAILAQIETEDPYRLLALYSLGQIAAERGESGTALDLFRRVEEGAGGVEQGGFLAVRAARSRAEVLLAAGRGPDAVPLFEALVRIQKNPMDRIGLAAAGDNSVFTLDHAPAELIAGLPLEDRVRFLLLLGGVARKSGRDEKAVDSLIRAGKELEEALSPALPPLSEAAARSEVVESLRLQLSGLRQIRQGLSSREPTLGEAARAGVVELLVGMLFADRTVSLAAADTPSPESLRFLTAEEIAEIVRRIEEVSLDGIEVDRLVERMAATLDTLQNLGHPIQRYRRLALLEKSQEEIHLLRERIQERREVAVATIEVGRDVDAPRLLKDVGLFLKELDVIRSIITETREFTKQYFDVLRKKEEPSERAEDPLDLLMRETIAYSDGRVTALLPVVRTLEERERAAAWERRKPELLALRSVVARQLADALVGQARRLRLEPGETAHRESLAALGRAVFLLTGDRLAPGDASDVAVGIGSVLSEGRGRWVPYPGPEADEKEKELVTRVLPLLPLEGVSGARREEGLYLRAVLRMAVKDRGAPLAARELLERYPASPLSAEIGIQLGHEALLAGDTAAAISRYRAAADSGNPEASSVARYMLAWVRFQSGDADGALRELSHPLSEPSFHCGDPQPFERDVVSLSVRAWRESPLERLESYLPVKAGTCVGKILLTALWEAEEKRGETSRAAEVRDVASRRFPSDANAASLEMETVEAFLQAGREGEAVSRALTLREKYGPGSVWAQSQPTPVGEKTAKELAGMYRTLAGKRFDEGIRSGERSALSSSAALMAEYFQMREDDPSNEDGELRLKWAIALLGSGDREGGVLLLEELVGEHRSDVTGERAAILYAETMIAGYERKETPAEEAEDSILLLLEELPSETSASLGLRASSAFLSAREDERARRVAAEVEGNRSATPAQTAQARLILAESALFEGDVATARGKSSIVLSETSVGVDAGARAKDLYLLSSLKEAGGKETAGDLLGAAAELEEVSFRFAGAPEVPMYLLRAMRLYAKGGDPEGAIRSGLRFRKDFPRREEAAEVASVVGPLFEEKKAFNEAGDLYESVAERFPKGEGAPQFLFHAARLAEEHGPPAAAEKRFNAYRARYANPRWKWTYATFYMGLAGWRRGETKASIRLMEEGLRIADAGVEEEAPGEFAELAGKVRIAVGENWAEQFRKTRLLVPLDKSLAIKDRFFRRALDAFEKVESEAPLEVALQASLLSGDLLVEYGKAILASQRPKGLKGSDREGYEEALRDRARSFYDRSLDRYAGALDRLEDEEGPADLADPIQKRLEASQALLEETMTAKEGKGP
jgi:tetratricopeptide (TPR) repeat protein